MVVLSPILNEKFRYLDEYNTFMCNEAINQNTMRYEINSLLLESGSEVIIQEATLWENIKNFLSKIMKKIGGLFGKFLEHMNKLFLDDKGYLEHYKDIILKKTPVETEFTEFYDYNINMLLHELVIPEFDESIVDDLETEEKFINSKSFSKFMKNKNNTLADNLYAAVRGSALTVSSTDTTKVNMTNFFNYCYTYESNMKPNIQKDQKALNNASVEVTDMLNSYANEVKEREEQEKAEKEKAEQAAQDKKKEEENKRQNPPPEEDKTKQTNSGATVINTNTASVNTASAIISSFDQYFSELSIGKSKAGSTGSASIGSTDKMPGKNISNISKNNLDDIKKGTEEVGTTIKDNKEITSDEIKSLQSATSVYFSVCGSVIAAKLTLAQEIYKSYMSIIRWHVQQFAGTKAETDKTQQAASTSASDVNKDTSGRIVDSNDSSTDSGSSNTDSSTTADNNETKPKSFGDKLRGFANKMRNRK